MLNGFQIGRFARIFTVLAGLLAAGAVAVLPAQAEPVRIAEPVRCGIVDPEFFAPAETETALPPRCEAKTRGYSYKAKIVDGKLVVLFGNGTGCTVTSITAVIGKLDKDGVTMEAALNARGDGLIKADVTIKCGDQKFTLVGFQVSYDAQTNGYSVDEGVSTPVVEV